MNDVSSKQKNKAEVRMLEKSRSSKEGLNLLLKYMTRF